MAVGQRFCQACGSPLTAHNDLVLTNLVGDGGKPLATRSPEAVRILMASRGTRIVLWASGIALALLVIAAIVVAVIGMLIAAVAALTPVVLCIAVLWLLARSHRRRRHWI